jgi:hypothetical protein
MCRVAAGDITLYEYTARRTAVTASASSSTADRITTPVVMPGP